MTAFLLECWLPLLVMWGECQASYMNPSQVQTSQAVNNSPTNDSTYN